MMDPLGQASALSIPKESQVSLHGQVLPPVLLEEVPDYPCVLNFVDAHDTKRRDIWWPKLLIEMETPPSAGSMPSLPTSDIDRFMCIAYLLNDVALKVLRKLFHYHAVTPTCTLDQYLAKNRSTIESLNKRKILNMLQMNIMFPPNGDDTNLDDYNIILLSALINNIVPSLSRQEMNLVQSLRDNRNELYGRTKSCRMNANDFQTCWNNISVTLITLSQQCGDPNFENEIIEEIQQTRVPNASYLSILQARTETLASAGSMPFLPTSDIDRFMCIAYLLNNVASKVLRKLFHYHAVTPTCTLDQYLAKNSRTINRLQRRLLHSSQMVIMFPPNGDDTNLEDYDINLLTALFNNIVPSLGHQEKNLVIGLRDHRNRFAHAESSKMNAIDFQTCWNDISSTLITLSQQCGDPNFENEILKEIRQTQVPDVLDPVIPTEILHMDERSLQLYKEALRDGKEKVYNIRVMVVGHYGVGKTTLIKRLLEQQVVISDRNSTEGIDVHKHCCKVVLATGEWNVQLEDSDQMARLQRLVKHLTGQPERPVVSSEQGGQMDIIYKREITTEDFYGPVHDSDDDNDDTPTSSVSGTEQSVVINSKQIENTSLVKADQKQETGKGDATMEFLKLVNENADKLKKTMVEFAALSVWDFAGQSIFYTTHQTFLTCRAIYLLVTDLSKQVTDLVKDDDCFIDAEGVRLCQVQEHVEIWLNSIHCCTSSPVAGSTVTPHAGGTTLTAPEASTTETPLDVDIPVNPPVILVGTHVDEIKEDKRQEVTSGYFQQICHILKDKPTSLHLKDFVAIDNNHVDPKLKTLKDRIFKLAKEQPYWGEEVPTNWIPLEEALMQLKASGKKVIPLRLVEELNRGASVPIKTVEQLDLFLRFEHEIGTILYFNVEGLREKIVLDPQWLIDALKSLITADTFILKKYPRIRNRWFEFRDKGKLTPELIDAVWRNNPEFHDNKQHILLLMEKLSVIAKPRSYIGELKEESYYLAPCMLRDAVPKEVICPKENPQMEKTSLLCFEFTGKFLPTPVFHRLLAACVSHWQIATQNDKTQIFCGCCIFDLDLERQHRLTLYFRNYIIFVQVTRMGVRDIDKSSEICTEARTFISENLTKIIGNLGQTLKFEQYIKCPDSDADSPKGLIAVSLLKKEENAVCHSHDESHTLASQELLKFWFREEETSLEVQHSPSPMPSPPISDTDRFMCIAYLLVDVGAQVLRRLFHHTVTSTCTVDQYLANKKKCIENLKRIFNQSQMVILFPASGGNTCLDAYDITLLSALFQNIVPTLGTQEKNMIKSLRDDRNNIFGHASSCKINTSDYQTYWSSISYKLIALSKQCGDPAFETQISSEIHRIYGSAIPAGSYLDILKAWFYRIETVEDELQDVKSRLQALESKEKSSKSEV